MTDNAGSDLHSVAEIVTCIGHWYGFASTLTIGLAALLGLLVAKWLAAIAVGLPRLIEREWRAQGGDRQSKLSPAVAVPRLRVAGWRRPAGAHSLRGGWRRPLLGWTGKQERCAVARGSSYCGIRVVTAALFAACAWRFGPSPLALCAMGLAAALLVLAWIDLRSGLLPDAITLPLIWAGLLVNLTGALAPLPQSVLGAVTGYGFLWMMFHLFKCFTGREGMGRGDFKLLAALGAWLGLTVIPWLLLAAALAGGVIGLLLIALGRVSRGQPLPFGPYLAAAGMMALLLGERLS